MQWWLTGSPSPLLLLPSSSFLLELQWDTASSLPSPWRRRCSPSWRLATGMAAAAAAAVEGADRGGRWLLQPC